MVRDRAHERRGASESQGQGTACGREGGREVEDEREDEGEGQIEKMD